MAAKKIVSRTNQESWNGQPVRLSPVNLGAVISWFRKSR